MAAKKVRAGRYTLQIKSGLYTIKNVKSKVWLVLNDQHRKVAQFETLSAAEGWLLGLSVRPASDKSKNYLRDLLAQHAGSELAEKIRAKLNNDFVNQGQPVPQDLVSLAIKQLTTPAAWASIPQQRADVMPRAEAIATARAAVAASRA